jgi:hypothetical protein
MSKDKMSHSDIVGYLDSVPDEVLEHIQFSMPWQYTDTDYGTGAVDSDGFPIGGADKQIDTEQNRSSLQEECFQRYHRNPYMNTAVNGVVGRLTGMGFETTSFNQDVQRVIEEIETDPRNRLWYWWPKYIARYIIEGELFLILTLHRDGFVEVDFVDPTLLSGGDDGSGVIFHPFKTQLPLFYCIKPKKTDAYSNDQYIIPSINIGRYPKLESKVKKSNGYDTSLLKGSKIKLKAFRQLGGYKRFVISMGKGLVTRRAISHLRTTIEWLNHYENLKKYEIDHKKSSGAYTWVFTFEDVRAFRTWLTLTDEEKRQTAVGSKMTPGSKLILPPGMSVEAKNPNLTSIKDQDTDILQMIAGGMNEPQDIMTGTSAGGYSSVKASRGPMSDRISDEVAFFERWLRYEFWGSIFFLKSAIGKFSETVPVKEAVGFKENKEPIMKTVQKRPEMVVDISFPTSDIIDYEARARGMLGVKHGPLSESLGVSNTEVARRMGFGGYGRQRLKQATEKELYPDLVYEGGVDAESLQETTEGETPKKQTGGRPETVKEKEKKPELIKRKK